MRRNILCVPVSRVENGNSSPMQDLLAVEEPLELRVNGHPVSITMRTPGHDYELAAGFLFTEGIVSRRDSIERIVFAGSNSVNVELKPEIEADLGRLQRHFYTSSSCGVCGKASLNALAAQGLTMLERDEMRFSPALISEFPNRLREAQPVFNRTGGLHAAALFDKAGELLSVREDVGRHNALDKLIGSEMLAGRIPVIEKLLLVSGRVSFELLQKAVMARIPVVAAVGAPSNLAVEVAQRFNITLLGFVRDGRFNVYAGGWRME